MAACESGLGSEEAGDSLWVGGGPLPTADQLEQRAHQLVEKFNAKRLRDEEQLNQLKEGLSVVAERAQQRLEDAWYAQMKADSEAARQQLEVLFEVIGQVAEHEQEVQHARDELNKLIREMADRDPAVL